MRIRFSLITFACVFVVLLGRYGQSYKTASEANQISTTAKAFVTSLSDDQKKQALHPIDSPKLVGWHFIPMDSRKGLELNNMSTAQRSAADKLLASVLSESGYDKATKIMNLESLLKELQDKNGGRGPIRDPLRYYFTVFGEPSLSDRWALSIEGHHLSLNFVIEGEKVVSSTPQFFATNPATVKSKNNADVPLGTRLLRFEETLAFELINTMSKEQLELAVIEEKAPREIRAAGEAQPPQTEAVGVPWRTLSNEQRKLLRRLLAEYIKAAPKNVAAERNEVIKAAGFKNVHFAWAGSKVPGVGHYYRVQGPTFLIEFVNTQPDADGNPANHVHCVWRNMHGDFGKSIGG